MFDSLLPLVGLLEGSTFVHPTRVLRLQVRRCSPVEMAGDVAAAGDVQNGPTVNQQQVLLYRLFRLYPGIQELFLLRVVGGEEGHC